MMSQPPDKPQQFSLAALLLVTTLIAVCLALFRVSPGIGVLSLFLIVPALLRTTLLAQREKQFGGRLAAAEKVAVFLGSVVVVLAIIVAGGVAFGAICLGGFGLASAVGGRQFGPEPGIAIISLLLALAASVVVAGWISWATWPKRDDFVKQLHRSNGLPPDPERQPRDPSP